MSSRIIIPILNKRASFFKGPTCSIDKDITIQTISPEDLGIIHKSVSEEYTSILPKNFKCITIDNFIGDDKNAADVATIITFLLNFFKKDSPISLAFCVKISVGKTKKYDKTIPFNFSYNVLSQRTTEYKIKTGNSLETVSSFLKLINSVYTKQPSIILPLGRFNSSLYRNDTFDKIVDITVALESLINGKNELSFRFCLYNAITSEKDETRRKDTFALLKTLYNSRSTIVHGSEFQPKEYKKTIEPIQEQWGEIVAIAQRSIAYHLLFINSKSIEDWFVHQEQLALGTVSRYL